MSKSSPGTAVISRPFISPPNPQTQGLPQSIAKELCTWTTNPIPEISDANNKVRVICISDTHNTKPSLPDGDILLHAGDLSQYGLFDEIQAQLDWLNAQNHKCIIIIGGNHDLILDAAFVKQHPDRELDKPGKSRADLNWGRVIYLQNSSIELQCNGRSLRIYGSAMTPKCGNFGFQYDPEEDIWADTVPDGTDILLTHGPPALHLDQGKGCKHLLKEIWRARPKLVVFGHIHLGRGERMVAFDGAQANYENILLGRSPLINLFKLLLCILSQSLSRRAERKISPTHLVNAAVVAGRGNQDRKDPTIVYV